MNVFRSWRLWPMLALFALFCLASTPATAWACACHMAVQGNPKYVPSTSAPVVLPQVAPTAHACCLEGSKPLTSLKQAPFKTLSSSIPTGTPKPCCCHADEHNSLPAGEKAVWNGWNFVAFAITPPIVLALESPTQTASVYHPVAQSPPESPPPFARRGRAPPVLAA